MVESLVHHRGENFDPYFAYGERLQELLNV